MRLRKTLISVTLAIIMILNLSAPTFASAIADQQSPGQGVEAQNTSPGQSFTVGNLSANEPRTVKIFEYTGGRHTHVTIRIQNFNTADYVCNIMVYDTHGLISRENDYLGTNGSPTFTINPGGEYALTAIYMSIAPRPKLLFQAPYRTFTVTTNWA